MQFLRFILFFPTWDLTSTFNAETEDGYKFLTKAASIWLLISCISALILIYGIWNVNIFSFLHTPTLNLIEKFFAKTKTLMMTIVFTFQHQPMHVLPFLIIIYVETSAFAIASVVLAAFYGAQAEIFALSLTMALGWFLTGDKSNFPHFNHHQ